MITKPLYNNFTLAFPKKYALVDNESGLIILRALKPREYVTTGNTTLYSAID